MTGGGQTLPDWAKDWHASVASSGPFKLKSAPCMENGSTSFRIVAGSFTEQTLRMAETFREEISGVDYSFYDNARYITLSKHFGPGFVPIGCQ